MEVVALMVLSVWVVFLACREVRFRQECQDARTALLSLERRVRELEEYRGYVDPDGDDDWKPSVYREDD